MLASHGFQWQWVNHSKAFKDPVTGVHTNRIEGKWKWLKSGIPHGARRRDVEEYIQLHNLFKKDKIVLVFVSLDILKNFPP